MDIAKTIIKAAKTGDVEAIKACIAADPASVHATDAEGSTPLHFAAWKGHPEIATFLLENGAEISRENAVTHWGGTPLHAAAHGNNALVARILIENGADVSFRSFNGRTPLQETTIHNATTVAKLLKQHGATE
jgi:ankyrin repeat protein